MDMNADLDDEVALSVGVDGPLLEDGHEPPILLHPLHVLLSLHQDPSILLTAHIAQLGSGAGRVGG